MTLTGDDLILLEYAAELPLAGCLYACRGLFHAADYARESSPLAMRQAAGGAVIELAFQRFLSEHGIPFDQEAVTPFTTPEHASLVLGGRLCQVVPIINDHPVGVNQASRQVYLEESRLPQFKEQGLPDVHEDEELLVYAALSWLPRAKKARETAETTPQNGQEMLVHALPASWAQPQPWASLGEMRVKSGCAGPLKLRLDGQNDQRQYQTETLSLLAGEQQIILPGFYALGTLRTEHHPTGRTEIRRKGAKQAYVVYPHQWAALWHPGNQITLLGYLTWGEARRMTPNLPGTHVPLTQLHALPEMFERVKQWAQRSG